MTLYELLTFVPDGDEVTVTDMDYSIETYFYGIGVEYGGVVGTDNCFDSWDKSMIELSKLLSVEQIMGDGTVTVNLAEIIEKNIEKLNKADLFIKNDIDDIIDDIESILAGNVSEKWMEKFVETLK